MKSRPKKTEAAAFDAVVPASAEKAPWSIKNLSHAWNGLLVAWRVEIGFRNHVLGGLAMLTLLIFLRPEPMWWAVALLCSAFLITLELINTTIERLVDFVDRRTHPEIRIIKDMSAAAVIVGSAGVLIVGIVMIVDTVF